MLDTKLLAIEGHGAIQVDKSPLDKPPKIITLVGPIAHWWEEWDSPRHQIYVEWRGAVETLLVKNGHLVYSPWKAIRGSWHPRAQRINEGAICVSDGIVALTPPDVPARETAREVALAAALRIPVINAPPGDARELDVLLSKIDALNYRQL